MLDVTTYHGKLARREVLSEDEILTLLSALRAARKAAAYLGECHAATLESLPKRASKSERARLVSICAAVPRLLDGDVSSLRDDAPTMIEHATRRCREAVAANAGEAAPQKP